MNKKVLMLSIILLFFNCKDNEKAKMSEEQIFEELIKNPPKGGIILEPERETTGVIKNVTIPNRDNENIIGLYKIDSEKATINYEFSKGNIFTMKFKPNNSSSHIYYGSYQLKTKDNILIINIKTPREEELRYGYNFLGSSLFLRELGNEVPMILEKVY